MKFIVRLPGLSAAHHQKNKGKTTVALSVPPANAASLTKCLINREKKRPPQEIPAAAAFSLSYLTLLNSNLMPSLLITRVSWVTENSSAISSSSNLSVSALYSLPFLI